MADADESTLSQSAQQAVSALIEHSEYETARASYEVTFETADVPLVQLGVGELVDHAVNLVSEQNLVLPDVRDLLERAVVALMAGNAIFHGPPGTGKTTLARLLAQSFGCEVDVVTGTPDWTTYDVIGGLRPARDARGAEVLRPSLGHVPRTALQCAEQVAAWQEDHDLPQAHWLIIDELSRAEIDKAVGPLYTALSGGTVVDRTVPLWFEDAPARQAMALPERYRIVGTMNDVDTAFVYSMSQGLQRRFEFVPVGVPTTAQIDTEEMPRVSRQAAEWYEGTYGGIDVDDLLAQDRMTDVLGKLGELVRFLRWDEPQWPLGSAQLVSVLRHVVIRAAANEETSLGPALDTALMDLVVPQASNLTESQLDAIETWLNGKAEFKNTLKRLQGVRGQLRATIV
jgi:5-methylcytosine-specific restriction protein B